MERGTARLFARYERLSHQIEALEARLKKAREDRSEAARGIFTVEGSGPFVWKKKRVQIARMDHEFVIRAYGKKR